MPKFKSKHIQVLWTEKAHMIRLNRHDSVWIPASVCECVEDSRIEGEWGYKVIYSCTIKQWYVDKYPKMLPLLQEKKTNMGCRNVKHREMSWSKVKKGRKPIGWWYHKVMCELYYHFSRGNNGYSKHLKTNV